MEEEPKKRIGRPRVEKTDEKKVFDYPAINALVENVEARLREVGGEMKQAAKAEKAGWDQSNLRKLLARLHSPTLERVQKLADSLETDAWRLLKPKAMSATATRQFAEQVLLDEVRDGISDEELIQIIDTVKLAVKMKKHRVTPEGLPGTVRVYFRVDRRINDEPANKERRSDQGWTIQNPADPSDYIQPQRHPAREAQEGPETGE